MAKKKINENDIEKIEGTNEVPKNEEVIDEVEIVEDEQENNEEKEVENIEEYELKEEQQEDIEVKEIEDKEANEEVIDEIKIEEDNSDKEAKEDYSDVKVILYQKEYTVAYMNELMLKENKTYNEKVLCNRYREEMKNLYLGIERVVDNTSSYKIKSIEEVEKNLNYKYIEQRCSRRYYKFDKKGVDAVIDYMKKFEVDPLQK